jgi:hypothetical protein
MRIRSLLALLVSAPLSSACSSSTDERQPITSTPEDYCQRACAKAHACFDTIDPAECRSACQAKLTAGPKLRADFLGYVAGCIEESACSSMSSSKCKSEAQAQLSSSPYGKTLCSALLAAGANCGPSGATYAETGCLQAAKSYADGSLKIANDCLAKPCETLGACLTEAIPDVTLTP